jgi:hypothetical protein
MSGGSVKIKKTTFMNIVFDKTGIMDGVDGCNIPLEECIFEGIRIKMENRSVISGEVSDEKLMIISNCSLSECV